MQQLWCVVDSLFVQKAENGRHVVCGVFEVCGDVCVVYGHKTFQSPLNQKHP